ncbi:MAG: YqaJ viral recombinase family protein [Moraxellaceae bacterium]|nr:YqaJ viral recombinase family protein [Moraxellaceae bacterium]
MRCNMTRSNTAIRLVSTKDINRQQWLEVRKQGLGSSDAAAAVGLNPYQSQLELWLIKTGRDADLPKPDATDESSPMYWGNILEPIVAAHYTKHTGHKVRRINAVLQHPESDKSWMLANLDYAVVGADDVQVLECKTAGEYGARNWREGVPEYVQCQVQHQLAVTGKQAADVCVLICGQEIKIHRIERDEALITKLIELERRFWHYVLTDTPPPADGSESAGVALRYLYPYDTGNTLDFSQDKEVSAVFSELLQVRVQADDYKKREDFLRQCLQQRMGEASKASFANGSISWKRSKDSVVLDTATLLQERPELLKQYALTRAGSRRFLVQSQNS